nr:unnamed protein product [Callosobruchus chinensis]
MAFETVEKNQARADFLERRSRRRFLVTHGPK